MKSMLVAGTLVAVSSVAFAQCGPESQTSNANTAGMGGSTHGRATSINQTAQANLANCVSTPASETSNSNGAGLGGSTHGRRW